MKHASPATLQALDALLRQIRALPGLTERKPGTFYRKSSAFLHFHEDPEGIFADAKLNPPGFMRFRVSTAAEQSHLMRALRAALAE